MSREHSRIERLAKHLQRPVPESVRTRARLHLLDWLACVAGARASAAAQTSSGLPGSARQAALLGNVLEMDDVHRTALLHPGPVIWATVFMQHPQVMDEVLDAAVRGYEAMIAIGSTFDAFHYRHWHPTSTAGVFGATAAAASHFSCSELQTGWALANAASVAGGLWHMRHDDVLTKQWHILNAARIGGNAVWSAMDGLTGPLRILEGPQGLYEAMTRNPKALALRKGWRIEEVSFKPWAACRHAHPAIDCALELRAAGRLEPPFHVETYRDALTFCDRPDPKTELDAKFSLQHAVAVMASGGAAEPADFTPEAIARLAPLRAEVMVAEAPEITARYPDHFGARVNGFELVDCRGDPERPVGEADIVAKMRMLADWGGLAAAEADRAADLALSGDDARAVVVMLEEWLV